MAISRAATLAATIVLASGCGGGRATPGPAAPAPVEAARVLPRAQLFVLEQAGVPPEDTAVSFRAGQPRMIVLRHGPPDNTVYVELAFPARAFGDSGGGDSVTVTVHPRPGLYGVDVASTALLAPGAVIRFKYPVHFSAPLGAVARYGSAARYEHQLAIAELRSDSNYALLRSTRPASDNLEAPLDRPGTYLVAAPK